MLFYYLFNTTYSYVNSINYTNDIPSKIINSEAVNPNNITSIHRGRAKINVSVKCLVLVDMYGNSPRKLFVRIIRNNDVKMNEFPLFSLPFLRIVFIS